MTLRHFRSLLLEAGLKTGVSDEHAFASIWNYFTHNDQKPMAHNLGLWHKTIENARKNQKHPLNIKQAGKVGFVGGTSKGRADDYYKELHNQAHAVYGMAHHPRFSQAAAKGLRASVAGASAIPNINPSWSRPGIRTNKTSRADVNIGEGPDRIGVSLKKGSGQLSSAHFDEMRATAEAVSRERMKTDKNWTEESHGHWMHGIDLIGKLAKNFGSLPPKRQERARLTGTSYLRYHMKKHGMENAVNREMAYGGIKFGGGPGMAHAVVISRGRKDPEIYHASDNKLPSGLSHRVRIKRHSSTGPRYLVHTIDARS